MPKAKTDPNSVPALAREIATLWPSLAGVPAHDQAGLSILATILARPEDSFRYVNNSPPAAVCLDGSARDFITRLRQGADRFVSFHKLRLSEQGLKRFSEAGLLAFFFSALYEALRFDTSVDEDEPSGRRKRPKRRGASYFTPPSLAYLAAYRALSAYFAGAQGPLVDTMPEMPLPHVCDPAMGTGLYLVAALDYLSVERPDLCRTFLADKCLFGVELDAITCSAAKNCLALAAGAVGDKMVAAAEAAAVQSAGNLFWADGLLAQLQPADIVLSNPPWDIVKAVKTQAGGRVPSRVNKARSASLRGVFGHQGEGDTSYYKLFLERSYHLLKPGGVASVLVPAAFCGDKGAAPLRALIMDSCNWLSLDGFVNEDNAFAIHPHFKYVLLCYSKGLSTQTIKTRFGLVAGASRLIDKSGGALAFSDDSQFLYDRALVQLLGGPGGAILELGGKDDANLLKALYQNHGRLRDFLASHGNFFRREFDMTLDRHRFITAKRAGQIASPDHVTGSPGLPTTKSASAVSEAYLPLFEGRMIGQFDPGKQSAAARYFVKATDYRQRVGDLSAKLGFVSITSPFNTRSMIAAYLPDLPAGNSLPTLVFSTGEKEFLPALEEALYTTAIFNSFVFDWLVRQRLAGNNLSYHLLEDLPFPQPDIVRAPLSQLIIALSAWLSLDKGDFGAEICALAEAPQDFYKKTVLGRLPDRSVRDIAGQDSTGAESDAQQSRLGISGAQMLRFRLWLEVLVCEAFGLSPAQVGYIFRDCGVPAEVLRRRRRLNTSNFAGPFGQYQDERGGEPDQRSFFRVDKGLAAHLRLSNLVNCTFSILKSDRTDFVRALFDSLSRSDLSLPLPAFVEQALSERCTELFGRTLLHQEESRTVQFPGKVVSR
jgi:hypothetical protein